MSRQFPIGVFDSGYGGLTVLKEIRACLPQYDYIYLGDNARAPYGSRSFDTVYKYTLECVEYLFSKGCKLVILACNTASAKALRTIQQIDLPKIAPENRVLGVIRPTTETIGNLSKTGKIAILATPGTVQSSSYVIEIGKYFPDVEVFQQACPMWVPLIENNEFDNPGADYFINKYISQVMNQCKDIDTVLLACTHYPVLEKSIQKQLPPHTNVITQGKLVAESLSDYLNRHQWLEQTLSNHGACTYLTTDSATDFNKMAALFLGKEVISAQIEL